MQKKRKIDRSRRRTGSIIVTAAMVALAYLLSVTAAAATTRCERDRRYLDTALKAQKVHDIQIRAATAQLEFYRSHAKEMRDAMQAQRCGTPYQVSRDACHELYRGVDANVRQQDGLRKLIGEWRQKQHDAQKVATKLVASVTIYCDRPVAKLKQPTRKSARPTAKRKRPARKSARPGRRKDIDPALGPGIGAGIVWDILRKGEIFGRRPRFGPGRPNRCHQRRDGSIDCSRN